MAKTLEMDWDMSADAYALKRGPTSKITTEHEIQDKEAIFVVLERIAKIDNEGVVNLGSCEKRVQRGTTTNLLEKTTLLNNVGHGLHLHAFRLVDVLEGV